MASASHNGYARTIRPVHTSADGDSIYAAAAAAQIYAMYLQADWVARQAFPQTAEGDYLDLHAQLRGLERKQASHAAGTLRFFADQAAETPREIPWAPYV